MELTYDWTAFQDMFSPQRRPGPNHPQLSGANNGPAGPLHIVSEDGAVIAAYAEGEDLAEWVGSSVDSMSAQFPHRDLIRYDREKVDRWLVESLALPHLYDQNESLVSHAAPAAVSRGGVDRRPSSSSRGSADAGDTSARKHFLLEATQSWWAKVLPSAYGIFIRLEGSRAQDFFVMIRRGRITLFHEPDLSSIGPERRRQPADVVKYLSEKHLVPVQGVFVPMQEWVDWSDAVNPWSRVALAVRANRARLVPFRWGIALLVATRAFIGT